MTRLNRTVVVPMAILALFTVCLSVERPRKQALSESAAQTPLCKPASRRLNARATLAGREGTYILTLIQVVDGADARRAQGVLNLRRQPPGFEMLKTASTPLYGFTDVDLRAVGAHRVGDPASTDPEAPGVLVLESLHDGKRRILLRLGADANRRDSMLFDGAFTVLEVHAIYRGGFAGSWRSGLRSLRTGGYFCARRMDKKTGTHGTPRLE